MATLLVQQEAINCVGPLLNNLDVVTKLTGQVVGHAANDEDKIACKSGLQHS